MTDDARLNQIRYLLTQVLDSDEEYLYEGEMSNYVRSYATDAGIELRDLWQPAGPQGVELAACFEAITQPQRLESGRARRLLILLREASRSILDTLANSPDPAVRIFALETGRASLNPYFHDPLYNTMDLNLRLIRDPNAQVRAAAIATALPVILHNAGYIQMCIERRFDAPILDFLTVVYACKDDASPEVRIQAAGMLEQWNNISGQETFDSFIKHANSSSTQL